MRKIYFKTAVLMLCALCFVWDAAAQDTNTPQTVERIKMEGLWFNNTVNTAGVQVDSIAYYAKLSAGYNKTKGDWKRAQEGEDNNGYGFSTEGGGHYDALKGAYIWGYFDYSRVKIQDALYNASLIDPLRGMPYYIADKNKSNWINQDYSLGFRAATPRIWDHLFAGVAVNYQNAQGAKQLDPRPNVMLEKFEVIPSVAWNCKAHTVGAQFSYFTRREDGTASNSTSFITQPIWEVVGPGFFNIGEIGAGTSGVRNYNANSLGGGIDYSFQSSKFKVLVGLNYTFTVEDANNNYTTPKTIGTTKENIWKGNLNIIYSPNTNHSFFFNANYSDRNIDGIEYIQVYDNTFEVAKWVVLSRNIRSNYHIQQTKFNLEWMKKDSRDAYSWMAGIDIEAQKFEDTYYIPKSTQSVNNIIPGAHLKKNFIFENASFLIGIKGALKSNSDKSHSYNGINADSQIYKDMVLRDYAFLSSNAYMLGGELSFNCRNLFGSNMSMFINAVADYWKATDATDFNFNDRLFLNVRVGLVF